MEDTSTLFNIVSWVATVITFVLTMYFQGKSNAEKVKELKSKSTALETEINNLKLKMEKVPTYDHLDAKYITKETINAKLEHLETALEEIKSLLSNKK